MLLDKASSKGKFALKILAVFLICAADMLFAAWVIYAEKQKGTLLSVRAASSHLPQLFAQNLLTSAVPAFLVFLALVICKKRFVQAMQLTVPKGKTRKIAVLLLFLLLIVTAAALIVKPDKITVLYSLFYYTVFIAFCEEFVVRGVCVGLLRDEPAAVRYLVPNILFAAMHVFAYADFGAITASYLVRFVCSQMAGLVAMGCLFQYLKEKSGSLWIPVLVHAVLDYTAVFGF